MPIELLQVLLALLLGFAYFTIFAVVANLELGTDYTAGPRDHAPAKPMSKGCARLHRAHQNFVETFPMFAAAMIVAHLAGAADNAVVTAGWVYLIARVVYLPAYWSGVPYLRSLVWSVATLAILFVVVWILL